MQKTLSPLLGACKNAILASLLFMVLGIYMLSFASPQTATAATSKTVNFQARLMNAAGAIVPDGNYNVEFKLYNALTSSGSSQGSCSGDSACLWTETRVSTDKVHVANGYLTVELGSVTALPTSIDWSQNLYLTMNIGGTGTPGWDGEMSPRLHLTAVPHAFTADQLSNTSGSFTSTLGFTTPTANRSILAPDESGTLCIQNSINCGFALSSGSGNYIQNGTSLQSGANFNISGTGTAGTALQAPLFDTATATALGIGTTNATAINLNKSTAINGGLTQSGGAISLTGNAASSITTSTGGLTLTAAGTSNWTVGGTNQSLTITTSGTGVLTLGTTGAGTVTMGSSSATINIGITNNAHTVHIADGGTSTTQTVIVGSTNGSSSSTIQGGTGSTAINLTTGTNGKINLTAAGTGGIVSTLGSAGFALKTTTDSTMAFAVQASNNDYIFSVNTSSGTVTLGAIQATYSGFDGTLNAPFGTLTLGRSAATTTILGSAASTFQATSGSFTTTLSFATPTANRAIVLPDEGGTVCIRNSTNCGFAATSGSANYIQNTTTAQSANMYVQAATSGSVAGILRANAAGAGDILDLKNGAGTNVATFGSTGAVLLQNSTDSANAFVINTSAGGTNQNVLRVDTISERVAIGVVGGTPSAKLNIATGSTVGLRVFDNGAFNSLELANGTANTMTVDQYGGVIHKTTTNATSAFQIQNATSASAFNVDTTNLRVGIGGITTPAVSLDVQGAVQQTGLATSNTNGTDANKWTLLGTCTIAAQYRQCIAGLDILGGHDGNGGDNTQATLTMRVKQQNAMGGAPYVNITMNGTAEIITKDDIVAVTTQNDGAATVVQLYGRITNTFEQWYFTPTMNTDQSPSKWVWSAASGFLAALPAGTQNVAVYGDDYSNSLTVRPSANSTSAFKVQNAAGTNTAFSVDSGNLRVAVGGTFNPQETVDVVGNLQVRDATTATKSYRLRTSGGGLDFEGAGANLVLSMWSGAGYTGTQYNQITFKNDGSSMDFARGFNVSSGTAKVGLGGNTNPQYALDVTGEINASVGLRVNSTTVCDTTGSTGCIAKSGSGFYIHNQTTQQTANLNVVSAATNSVTALFQGASGQTANILQINDGSSNALLTVGPSTVTVGYGGNTVTFGSGFEPTLAGNARHQKSIVLTAEYAGAVLDATNDATCSSANSGTMSSAYDLSNRANYYKWTSTSGSAQCYDVVVQVQVPSDWAAWNGAPTVTTYTSSTTNGTLALDVRDSNTGASDTGNVYNTTITPTANTTWQTRTAGTLAGTYNAGQVMTLRIRMSSLSSAEVRLGNITLNYYSKY